MKFFPAVAVLLFISCAVFGQEDYAQKKLTVAQCVELAEKYKEAGDIKEATRYLNTAAMQVWEDKNFPDAIRYFNQSIELNKQLNNASGIAKLNSNLGMIYSDLSDFEKSLSYFQLSLDYRLKYGEKSEIISTRINKAVVLNNLKRHDEAATNLEEALQLATEMLDANQMKSCYGMLAETYEKAGNQQKTIYYYELYKTFHEKVQRDRIKEIKKETELRVLETELEKKEKELQLMAASKELKETEEQLQNMSSEVRALMEGKTRQELAMSLMEQQLELDKLKIREAEAKNSEQKIWISFTISGLVVLFLFLLFLYRNNVYRKRTNLKLSEQNEEIKTLNESLESQVQNRTSELRKTLTSLEKRNRDLDQFSHVISHNLRGPVANILGLGSVFNKADMTDPINVEVFGRLQVATKNLDAVVKDLSTILDVKDNQSIPKERIIVGEVIESAKRMLRTEIENSGAEIIQNGSVKHVSSVKPYFESILYNLLSNAIKYSSPSRPPQVKISASLENHTFFLKVSDNGSGINAGDMEKIFEPYKRLTILGEGRGLGLYLVRTQVEAMNGSIEVTSEEGKGSTFTISLPQNL